MHETSQTEAQTPALTTDTSHRAPETLALIVRINHYLTTTGQTREWLLGELNKFLPERRRIVPNKSGMVKIYRWMNPTAKGWPEPSGEIALAMKKFIEIFIDPKK